jgi:sugar/nucleoside kinase (ribokinase family)
MAVLVTGTIGIDTVQTPFGHAEDVLGGSACHFSLAASLLAPVRLVGVVGADFPASFRQLLTDHNIDLAGMDTRADGQTFRWSGKYVGDMNAAQTTAIDLNVVAEAPPVIPESFRDSAVVFLAATHPKLQSDCVDALSAPQLIVADTRDFWIEGNRNELLATLARVHGAILNDGEARMLTDETNLIVAGRKILDLGPRFVIVKKGEHGAMLIAKDRVAVLPAIPMTSVKDPTGAGDSFAGGMMGYLDTAGAYDFDSIKRALAYGTVTASFTIEDFGPAGIASRTRNDVDRRLAEFTAMLKLD